MGTRTFAALLDVAEPPKETTNASESGATNELGEGVDVRNEVNGGKAKPAVEGGGVRPPSGEDGTGT